MYLIVFSRNVAGMVAILHHDSSELWFCEDIRIVKRNVSDLEYLVWKLLCKFYRKINIIFLKVRSLNVGGIVAILHHNPSELWYLGGIKIVNTCVSDPKS